MSRPGSPPHLDASNKYVDADKDVDQHETTDDAGGSAVEDSLQLGMQRLMDPLESKEPLERLEPFGSNGQFPPRRSSLVPIVPSSLSTGVSSSLPEEVTSSPPPTASTSLPPTASPSLSPTAPSPLPDLPFDFHRFLEQLRHRTADPVAKFLRSFLLEFGKKSWAVHEQVKIIADFLDFIANKMEQCDVWRGVSATELDHAREGMEKLVMSRLYSHTFSPAIARGRRGQHQEDVERDAVLAQKMRIYHWVGATHLDLAPFGEKGPQFLPLAQQELRKMQTYRAPRDKVICILNCCKVLFAFLRTRSSDQSADTFVPLLIYTVLHAHPDHLVSNLQYILRFRSQDKLSGEAGYYVSSLMGAVQFIEALDKTSLTVTDDEFDRNVEAAVSAIAERHASEQASSPSSSKSTSPSSRRLLPSASTASLQPSSPSATSNHRRMPSPHYHHLPEKATPLRPELTQRNSMEAERAGPRCATGTKDQSVDADHQPDEENAAVAGLLRTIQRPLNTIGRIFSDAEATPQAESRNSRATADIGHSTSLAPSFTSEKNQANHCDDHDHGPNQSHVPPNTRPQPNHISPTESAARQASAEAEQAQHIQRQEHALVVETLASMFPQLEREVIDDVVRVKHGSVSLAVDACLALANP